MAQADEKGAHANLRLAFSASPAQQQVIRAGRSGHFWTAVVELPNQRVWFNQVGIEGFDGRHRSVGVLVRVRRAGEKGVLEAPCYVVCNRKQLEALEDGKAYGIYVDPDRSSSAVEYAFSKKLPIERNLRIMGRIRGMPRLVAGAVVPEVPVASDSLRNEAV